MKNVKIPRVNLAKVGTTSIPMFPIAVILLVLKLVGVQISWFWVFFPLMLPLIFVASALVVVAVIFVAYLVCLGFAFLIERK